MSISTKIYLSARYKSSKPGGSRSERAFFEGCWAFTQKAADAGNNKRPNENVQSWPIELRSKQPYCGDVPPFGVYCGKFTTAEGEKFKDSVSLEFTANHDNSTILTVSGEGQNLFGLFRLNGTYCITTRVMTCTKTYGALKRSRPADILPHFNFSRPTNSIGRKKENVKDKKNSKKSKKSKKSLSDPRTFNFNIRLFKPVLKDIIAQLKMSEEHHLASHMERYQPLDKHHRARVLSIFTSNPRAQQEVTTSGKPREKVFRGFLARYDMKLQSSLIPDSHFRKLFRTLRSIKKNYKGNNLQHRVAIELKKAAHDCGIASLSSYRLEYRKRQKRHNARRDAESAAPLSAASMAKAGNPPLLEHLVDHSWKQRVNRAKYIERIWITMKKYQPRHTDLMTRAEKIEHDIIGRAKTEVKYIRAVVEWTELFSKQANDLERKQFGLYKRVFKLLEYYDNTRPTDLRLMSWDTDVAELKHLMQRVKVDLHVASSYRRMRDLFFKYKEVYTELKRTTTATEFEFDRGCVGMCAEIGETPGAIRYVGETPFGEGTWIGMELDTPTGNSNGIALGYDGQPTKYFSCRAHHGMFVHTGEAKPVLPCIRATDTKRFVTLLMCFQRRSDAKAIETGKWSPRFGSNVRALIFAFFARYTCVVRVTEYAVRCATMSRQLYFNRQLLLEVSPDMLMRDMFLHMTRTRRMHDIVPESSYYLWPAVGCPPENLAYEQLFDNERGGFILAGLQPGPTVTVGNAFGWQGDLVMLTPLTIVPRRIRYPLDQPGVARKTDIGHFVAGDFRPPTKLMGDFRPPTLTPQS